jgi:hypothetical protein
MVSNARLREERSNRVAVVKTGGVAVIVLDEATSMVMDDGDMVKNKID